MDPAAHMTSKRLQKPRPQLRLWPKVTGNGEAMFYCRSHCVVPLSTVTACALAYASRQKGETRQQYTNMAVRGKVRINAEAGRYTDKRRAVNRNLKAAGPR